MNKKLHVILAATIVCHAVGSDNNNMPPALQNHGNTCYLNSTLQCFNNLPLAKTYCNDGYKKLQKTNDQNMHLLRAFTANMQYMNNSLYKNSFETQAKNVTGCMQQETGSNNTQHDATELIRKAIGGLEALFSNNNERKKLFNIRYDGIITDSNGNQLNEKREHTTWPLQIGPFSGNDIPPDRTNIAQLLCNHTFKKEQIEYNGNSNANKEDQITSLPEYVTVQTTPQQFSYNELLQQWCGETPTGSPLNSDIIVPEQVQFCKNNHQSSHPFILPLISQSGEEKGLVPYRLNSCIVYKGNGSSGHYWAHVRKGEQWYKCDDTTITKEDTFPRKWNATTGIIPYLLFYERVNNDQLSQQADNYDLNAWNDTSPVVIPWWHRYKTPLIYGGFGSATLAAASIIYNMMHNDNKNS